MSCDESFEVMDGTTRAALDQMYNLIPPNTINKQEELSPVFSRSARRLLAIASLLPILLAAPLLSDGKGSGSSSQGSASGASNGGISYLPADVPTDVPSEITRKRVLCYTLKSIAASGTQPFILEPASTRARYEASTVEAAFEAAQGAATEAAELFSKEDANAAAEAARPLISMKGSRVLRKTPTAAVVTVETLFSRLSSCSTVSHDNPLQAGDTIVVAVDASALKEEETRAIEMLTLNLMAAAGTATTPAPVRPTSSQPVATVQEIPKGEKKEHARNVPARFALTWPVRLGGDTIPTVTVTALVRLGPMQTKTTNTPAKADECKAIGPECKSSMISTTVETTPYPDVAITLLAISLPQVHPLYYFNLATGIAASTLRNPTFYRLQQTAQTPGVPGTYTTREDGGDRLIAPVLFFTAYLYPMDSESDWSVKDLVPALAIGFSLTSPSTSFYLGACVEVRRNVQLVAGLNYAKVTALGPTAYVDPTSSASPVTKQEFHKGGFVALTFNIDFIKGLFGGGGKGT